MRQWKWCGFSWRCHARPLHEYRADRFSTEVRSRTSKRFTLQYNVGCGRHDAQPYPLSVYTSSRLWM